VLAGRLVPILACLVFGYLLIVKSRSFAAATIKEDTRYENSVRAVDIHAVLFSVVGVLLIGLACTSLPQLTATSVFTLSEYRDPTAYERRVELIRDNWIWACGVLLQSAFGIFLIAKARRLAQAFHGSSQPPVPDEFFGDTDRSPIGRTP
jgi:hypothetical protein